MGIEVLPAIGRWDDFASFMVPRKPGGGAYVDGEVAGWCSVAPKVTYRALVNSRTIPHIQDTGAWSVVCFVVRPGFRRRGLMHHLLDARPADHWATRWQIPLARAPRAACRVIAWSGPGRRR